MADKPIVTKFESNGQPYESICPGCKHMPEERSLPLANGSIFHAHQGNKKIKEPLRYPYFYCEKMHMTLGTLTSDEPLEEGKVQEIPDVAWCEGHEPS